MTYPESPTCEYSPRHYWEGRLAVTVIDCGPVAGRVYACQDCATFYNGLTPGDSEEPREMHGKSRPQ